MYDVEVIPAALEHIDDIMIVENLSFRIPWSRDSIIQEITKNSFASYFSASCGGRIVGYAGMWKVCDEGHITNVAVHPDFRSNGIGSALLQTLIDFAFNDGIARMTLEVRRSNVVAQGLYRKFGFDDAGIRKAYYADNGEDALIMWRENQIDS